MMVTSRDVSFPPVQCGRRTSAGLAYDPGIRALSSLVGAKQALTAVWYSVSLRWLCLDILSLLNPQEMA
jgi:hypothetical protein